MARVEVPLIGDLAILQGETYQALSLTFPGDLSTWTPRGQIRSKILEESGTLLAEFSFEASTYDADADTTTVTPRLTPAQTASLPKTKWQGIGEYSKTGVYYYDIELESDTGEVVKSKTAIVQVVGEVTGSGVPTPSTTEVFLTASNNLSEITDPATARENLGIVGGVKPDWNAAPGDASEILNKPDLSVYATSEAVSLALAGKEDADPTILKEADLGTTIQPFNADTVVDSEYPTVKSQAQSALQPSALNNTALTGTPTAPTAPEGTNTTQIATTAFVLANAGGGVDNGVVINGVANFWQPAAPTQRIDGSPLVISDRWFGVKELAFWNGSYWLSDTLYQTFNLANATAVVVTINNNGNSIFPLPIIDQSVFLEKAKFTLLTNGAVWSDTNYYSLGSYVQGMNVTALASDAFNSSDTVLVNQSYPGTIYIPLVFDYQLAVLQTSQYSHLLRLYITSTKFGTAPDLRIYSAKLEYRHILG